MHVDFQPASCIGIDEPSGLFPASKTRKMDESGFWKRQEQKKKAMESNSDLKNILPWTPRRMVPFQNPKCGIYRQPLARSATAKLACWVTMLLHPPTRHRWLVSQKHVCYLYMDNQNFKWDVKKWYQWYIYPKLDQFSMFWRKTSRSVSPFLARCEGCELWWSQVTQVEVALDEKLRGVTQMPPKSDGQW